MLAHAQGDRGGSRRTLSGSSRRVHIFTTAEVCGAHGASRRDLWCVSCEGLESGFAMPDTWRCIQLEGTYGRGAQIPSPSPNTNPEPNKAVERTAKSVRSCLASAFGSRSPRAFGSSFAKRGKKKTGAEPAGARATQKTCTRNGRTLQFPGVCGPLAPLFLEYIFSSLGAAGWA